MLFMDFFETFLLLFNLFVCYVESTYRFFFSRTRKSVQNEVVLITGSGNGIGRELAYEFARIGATVVLWDINEEANEKTEQEIRSSGGSAYQYACDISKSAEVRRVADLVRADIGDVTILVNNAGIMHGGALLMLGEEHIRQTFDVNTLGQFWTVREFLPAMLEQDHGHIVTLASMTSKCGAAYLVDYSASKFALCGFTEALEDELHRMGKDGIRTTIACPLFVDTGMTKYPRQRWKDYFKLSPSECASVIVDGVLRDKLCVYSPRILHLLIVLSSLIPHKAWRYIRDFMDFGIDPQFKGVNHDYAPVPPRRRSPSKTTSSHAFVW